MLGVAVHIRMIVVSTIGIVMSSKTGLWVRGRSAGFNGCIAHPTALAALVIALIVRQPRYACPTLLCWWRHDRTILVLLSFVIWDRKIGRAVVLSRIGIAVCTDVAPKVDPVLAVRWLQGWLGGSQLGLVTLITVKGAFPTPASGYPTPMKINGAQNLGCE